MNVITLNIYSPRTDKSCILYSLPLPRIEEYISIIIATCTARYKLILMNKNRKDDCNKYTSHVHASSFGSIIN